MAEAVVDALEVIDVEHDHRQRQAIALGPLQFDLEPLLEVATVMDTGQRVGDRQRPQLFLHALQVGDVSQVAMPQRAALLAHFRGRLATHPAQSGPGQADPILLAPG
ncbi:hypothetical protein D3C79_724970 [compost metagenome]